MASKITFKLVLFCFFVFLAAITSCRAEEKGDPTVEDEGISEEDLQYSKGSLCGYCTYCKFCKLCDKDCPCEKSSTKPNCHMCKYCKFCYLCSLACDTVCQPGGFVDRVSSSLFSQLPKFDKAEVDKDLNDIKDWIEKTKDEL